MSQNPRPELDIVLPSGGVGRSSENRRYSCGRYERDELASQHIHRKVNPKDNSGNADDSRSGEQWHRERWVGARVPQGDGERRGRVPERKREAIRRPE